MLEELTVAQIIWLAKTVILVIAIIFTISEVVPAILEVIVKKHCENKQKPFQRILRWIKERKREKTEDDYLRRWMK